MGVPGFFAWLLKNKYGKIKLIKNGIDKKINWLMLDTNCLLHPCVSNIIEKYNNNLLELDYTKNIRIQIEEIIWNKIVTYINYIIEQTNPEYVYIAIDGVPPMGKILQQRQRRYKYLYDTQIKLQEIIKNIETYKTDTNIEEPIIPISSIELTPGTEYMERIHNNMLKYLEDLDKKNIKYIYSSYHDEGEGEHKILQYIKNNLSEAKTIVIYGLDADLLFLSLGLGTNNGHNLYVMREQQFFINKDKEINYDEHMIFNYVEINKIHELIHTCGVSTNDFIVLCYLVGNDFLPKILSLDIKKNGLDKIINAWNKSTNRDKQKKELVLWNEEENKYSINYELFKKLLEQLLWTEKHIFNNDNVKHIKNNSIKDFIQGKTADTTMLEKKEFVSTTNYYNYYLGIPETEINMDKNIIKNMVKEYIGGIEWCVNYYLNDCPNWIWGYNYMIVPLIKDILKYFPKKINLQKALRTLNPVESLILAIPSPTYKYVLEKEIINQLEENINIGYMFPKEFNIDINKEDIYWKCQVKIPIVEYIEYESEIKKINIKNEKNKIYSYITNII